jgi:pimeloyl-ACP methyl ester carboxylesterase
VTLPGVDVEIHNVGLETSDLPRSGWGLALARGTFYSPRGVPRPRTAFIAAHYNLDFSQHYLGELLAERGFGFLGWNTRFCGAEHLFLLDRALIDIGLGVGWLRSRGAENVALIGNSGGGSLMAAYLAQSARPVVRAARGAQLAEGVDSLPGTELYLSLAAHPGRPEVLTSWLDPAVTDEQDPLSTDPELDMYHPDHGPPYDEKFVERYRKAQQDRNHRITQWCREELDRVREAGHRDRLFTVPRTWADLRFTDPSLDPSDRPTPACYRGDPARSNRSGEGIGSVNTLRSWLAMWSLEESQCRSADYLGAIEAPALVIQATGDTGVFPSDARRIHDGLASGDKTLLELPGDHYFRGAGGERTQLAEQIAAWTAERGGDPA